MHWSERPHAPTNAYPSGDGRPFSESDFHFHAMVHLLDALDDRYEADPDVYVSGNLLIYYEKGNKRRRVAPDVFVVFGVPKLLRRNYLLWEEGRAPGLVIEVTSRRTRWEDTRRKFDLYRVVLRVPEFFLFDPLRHYADPPLQGYRLTGREYRPMRVVNGRLRSRQLGLVLEPNDSMLRLVDPRTGTRIPTWKEVVQERDRLRAIEAELERLRAELAAARNRPKGRNGR